MNNSVASFLGRSGSKYSRSRSGCEVMGLEDAEMRFSMLSVRSAESSAIGKG